MTTPYLIDGDPCYMTGFNFRDLVPPEQVIITSDLGFRNGFPLTPEEEAFRVQRMKEAWQCPEAKKRQSERTKLNHRNHDPEVSEKKSASMKATLQLPEQKARLSAQKKAYWDKWRRDNNKPAK